MQSLRFDGSCCWFECFLIKPGLNMPKNILKAFTKEKQLKFHLQKLYCMLWMADFSVVLFALFWSSTVPGDYTVYLCSIEKEIFCK